MLREKFKIFCIGMVITLLINSCQKVTDFYLGIPLQPKFTSDNYHEGMNIFGILRPDSTGNYNKSFVYIETVQKATEFTSFTRLDSVDVVVIRLDTLQGTDSVKFKLYDPGFTFHDSLYRAEIPFRPKPGERYRIVCKYKDLPDATGKTIIPYAPLIEEGSLSIAGYQVKFNIVANSSIKMIDIYLDYNGQRHFINRYIPSDNQNTVVNFNSGLDLTGYKLIIYGYDANMAAYYSNSNTSLNFNKYRTTYSTLESGFGVFGSVNFTEIVL